MHFRSLILILLLATSLPGCSALLGSRQATAEDPPGRIHLYYEFSARDLDPAPRGFHVYRAERREGPFHRITGDPIAPAPDARPGGVQLLLTDRELVRGKEYYYFIERQDAGGSTRKVTPVIRGVALLPDMEPAR